MAVTPAEKQRPYRERLSGREQDPRKKWRREKWRREKWRRQPGRKARIQLRAVGGRALRQQGRQIDDGLLKHVAPVHWNHINLTSDYSWRQNKRVEKGGSVNSGLGMISENHRITCQAAQNRVPGKGGSGP